MTFQNLLLPILLVVVFYFFLIRPQQKQRKEHTNMISSLKKGDKVITIGGLHGAIADLNEDCVTLKVNDGTRLVFDRSSVRNVNRVEGPEETPNDKKE